MVVEYTYSPWGEILSTTGDEANTIGVINPFRYRGYYYDEETELYYLNARYYDPETGRFISADMLVDGRTLVGYNLFAYCLNNPTNYSDPSGNMVPAIAIIEGLLQAAAVALIAILTYQAIAYYLQTPSGQIFTQSIADAMAGVADSIRNFASSKSQEEEKENEKDIALPSRRNSGQTYYHVTTSENALSIKMTGTLIGSSYEGGYVFAWKSYPNKYAIKRSGAHNKGSVIISFKTNAAFQRDTGISDPKVQRFQPVRSVLRGPVYVWDVQIVG